jgi:peptidoglycan/xylan/chitin deacetylase (PgdA/CDA1 family)
MTRLFQSLGFALIAGGLCLPISAAASAADATLLNSCFAPGTLAAVAGEEVAVKGNHTYDSSAKIDGLAPAATVPGELRGAIRRVDLPAGEKVIALTFDLCEQRGEVAGYDGRIIDYLRKERVEATFFAGGKWMESHRARTEQLMADPLFEIGNHTETHRNLRLMTPEGARQEILAPQKIYENARAQLAANQCVASSDAAMSQIAPLPSLFRFPYGACNDATLKAVNDAGMLAIQWDVSTGDPDPHVSAARIADAMMHEAKPGSIIIGHANGRGWHTSEALPIAIPKLKAKGYKFVTVSELLALGKPVISTECYDRKPGDTNRYDFLGGLQHPLNSAVSAKKARVALAPPSAFNGTKPKATPATPRVNVQKPENAGN